MKKTRVFYFLIVVVIILSACGPSQEELSTQTAITNTSIAKSWTSTPTLTPTLTPTPTKTPLPTTTPIGGGQGQILFLDGDYEANKWEIYLSNPNGTGRKQLTFLNGTISNPTWSPLGDKIAFSFKKSKDDVFQLYVMNFDGSDISNISVSRKRDYEHPSWSPDGNKITFVSESDEEEAKKEHPQTDIFVINSDGSNEIRITNDPATFEDDYTREYEPSWSPDGTKILFISYQTSSPDIFVMNPDGTERTALTNLNAGILLPSWSPDGKQIIFTSLKDGQSESSVNIMNSDGTGLIQVIYNRQQKNDGQYKFTPDGTKISFGNCCFNLFIMNLDGSDVTKLSSKFGWNFDWKR